MLQSVKNIILLNKISVKTYLGSIKSVSCNKNKKIFLGILLISLLILLFVFSLIMLDDIYNFINNKYVFLEIIFIVTLIFMFIIGINRTFIGLYFNNNIKTLIHMPLKPIELFISQLSPVIFIEYLIDFIILIPLSIIMLNNGLLNFEKYIYLICIMIFLPILPICYCSIFAILVMRYFSELLNKNIVKLLNSFIILTICLLVSSSFNVYTYVSKIIINIIPIFRIYLYGLVDKMRCEYFVFIIIIPIILLIILVYLVNKLYLNTLISDKSKIKNLNNINKNISLKKQSVIISLFKIDLYKILREPILFFSFILSYNTIACFLEYSLFYNSNFSIIFYNNEIMKIFIIKCIISILFLLSINGVSSTSISREGNCLKLIISMPINHMDYIKSKVISSIILVSPIFIIMIIVFFIFTNNIFFSLSLFVISLDFIIFVSFNGLLMDIISPNIYIDKNQNFIRFNLNIMKNMIFSIVLAIALSLIILTINLNYKEVLVILIVLLFIINLIFYYIIKFYTRKYFVNTYDCLGGFYEDK